MRRWLAVLGLVAVAACGGGGDGGGGGGATGGTGSASTTGSTAAAACVDSVPGWAPAAATVEDVCEIAELAVADLEGRGRDAELHLADGYIQSGSDQLGLANLTATALGTPSGGRADAVARFLDALLVSTDGPGLDVDYATAAPELRALLYPADAFPAGTDGFVTRPFAGDLFVTAVLDTPEAVERIPDTQLATWGVGEDDVLDLAVAQTLTDALKPQIVHDPSGLDAAGGDGDVDFYKGTWLLDPARLLDDVPPAGVVAVHPTRAELILLEVEPSVGAGVLDALAQGAAQAYAAGPNAVSDDLFWCHDGTVDVITTEDGAITGPVPAALTAALGP